MMNLCRGLRRITLLLSVVVTLTAWFWFSEMRYRTAEQKQKALEKDAEQYRCFWDCWDADDFLGASKRMVVADLLRGHDEIKPVIVPDGDDARVLYLAPDVVFPGIESLRAHLDTDIIPSGILRMSESALEEAAQAARAKCLALEPHFSRHFGRSLREILTTSVLEGGPVAAGTFGAVWLAFLLFRWIGRGFSTTAGQISAQRGSGDLAFASAKDPPEGTESRSCGSNIPGGVAEAGEQRMIVR